MSPQLFSFFPSPLGHTFFCCFVSFVRVGFESNGRGGNGNRKEIIKKKRCNATMIKQRPTQSGGRMEGKKRKKR